MDELYLKYLHDFVRIIHPCLGSIEFKTRQYEVSSLYSLKKYMILIIFSLYQNLWIVCFEVISWALLMAIIL